MKHRYHLWLVGALVLGSASIAQARTWKGSNGNSYDSLHLCFKALASPCAPVDRVIEVPNLQAIPKAVQTSRLARGAARPPQPVYFVRLPATRRLANLGSGVPIPDDTYACWEKGTNNFHAPPCSGASQILVNVIEH